MVIALTRYLPLIALKCGEKERGDKRGEGGKEVKTGSKRSERVYEVSGEDHVSVTWNAEVTVISGL